MTTRRTRRHFLIHVLFKPTNMCSNTIDSTYSSTSRAANSSVHDNVNNTDHLSCRLLCTKAPNGVHGPWPASASEHNENNDDCSSCQLSDCRGWNKQCFRKPTESTPLAQCAPHRVAWKCNFTTSLSIFTWRKWASFFVSLKPARCHNWLRELTHMYPLSSHLRELHMYPLPKPVASRNDENAFEAGCWRLPTTSSGPDKMKSAISPLSHRRRAQPAQRKPSIKDGVFSSH